jgi:hypothetical protein
VLRTNVSGQISSVQISYILRGTVKAPNVNPDVNLDPRDPRSYFKFVEMKRITPKGGDGYLNTSYTPDCAENAIHEAIMDYDEQKDPEPDDITPFVLKKLISVLQVPTFLFNLSLPSSVFPRSGKDSSSSSQF